MTDREFQRLKKRLTDMFEKWRGIFGLFRWTGRITFLDRYQDGGTSNDVAMEIKVAWPYKTYSIEAYMPVLAAMDDEEFEDAVVHELCHVLVEPLMHGSRPHTDESRDITEMVVTDVQGAILIAYRQ